MIKFCENYGAIHLDLVGDMGYKYCFFLFLGPSFCKVHRQSLFSAWLW